MPPYITVTPPLYDAIYARKRQDNYLNRLDREAVGDEIATLACTGFLSKGDLSRYKASLARYLLSRRPGVARGTLLDLGCGVGGLGRELARVLCLKLIGIDFSSVAITQARAAITTTNDAEVRFEIADFSATGLENESVSAVISLDALYLATNPLDPLREIHRVLITDGPLLFTLYADLALRKTRRADPTVLHWEKMLRRSRFEIIECKDVSTHWRHFMRVKHQRRWLERERIRDELGEIGEAELSVSAAMLGLNGKPSFLESTSRFEFICTRRG